MKNIINKLALLSIGVLVCSCGVGNAVAPNSTAACDAKAKNYEAAITAWTSDIGNTNKCQAAKTATEKLISACSIYTVAQKKVYQDQLTNWKCN